MKESRRLGRVFAIAGAATAGVAAVGILLGLGFYLYTTRPQDAGSFVATFRNVTEDPLTYFFVVENRTRSNYLLPPKFSSARMMVIKDDGTMINWEIVRGKTLDQVFLPSGGKVVYRISVPELGEKELRELLKGFTLFLEDGPFNRYRIDFPLP